MYAGICLCSVTRGPAIYGEGFCIKTQWSYQIGSENACKQARISNTSIGSKRIRRWKGGGGGKTSDNESKKRERRETEKGRQRCEGVKKDAV